MMTSLSRLYSEVGYFEQTAVSGSQLTVGKLPSRISLLLRISFVIADHRYTLW